MRTETEPLVDGLLTAEHDTERMPVRSRHRAGRPGSRRLWVLAALALLLAVGGLAVLVAPAARGPVGGAAPVLPDAVGPTEPVAHPASPHPSTSTPAPAPAPLPETVVPEPAAEVPVVVPSAAPVATTPPAAPTPPAPEATPTCDERPGRGHGGGRPHGDRAPRCP